MVKPIVHSTKPAPDKLVDSEGAASYGLFDKPVSNINYLDFKYRSPMGHRRGYLRKYLKYNQFTFIGLLAPDLVVGCAVVNLRYLSNAFVYVYQPSSGEMREYSFIQPLGLGTSFPDSPDSGITYFKQLGNSVIITALPSPRQRELEVRVGDKLRIHALLEEEHNDFEPLALCTKSGFNGWTYTQKAAGLKASGTLSWDNGDVDLGKAGACGTYDWSAGYMKGETFWHWGCFAGTLQDGSKIGLNAAAGVNETEFTENAFWIDGKLHKIDNVGFQFDRGDDSSPWRLASYDGKLELEFLPSGKRSEKLNFGLVASNFNQHFGRFRGRFSPDGKNEVKIHDINGFVEDHYAKW